MSKPLEIVEVFSIDALSALVGVYERVDRMEHDDVRDHCLRALALLTSPPVCVPRVEQHDG